MKARIKRKIQKRPFLYNVGQVFKACDWIITIQCDNMVFRECELDFLNLGNSAIDWEQRRYELAKDIIKVVIANDNGVNSEVVAKYSLNCADALIKRLKEVDNG